MKYWVSRMMLKDGKILTEKDMPQDANVFEGEVPKIGDVLEVSFAGRSIRARVGHYSQRFDNAPIMGSMYHVRVEEI